MGNLGLSRRNKKKAEIWRRKLNDLALFQKVIKSFLSMAMLVIEIAIMIARII